MRRQICIVLIMISVFLNHGGRAMGSAFSVVDLRCEDLVNPLGVEVGEPRLSWRMDADHQGAAQTAYQVLCATSPELLRDGKADLWDSGKVEGDQSQHVVYGGKKFARGELCYWTVRTWDENAKASAWSKPAEAASHAEVLEAEDGRIRLQVKSGSYEILIQSW